jgi:sugar transferase EpsL
MIFYKTFGKRLLDVSAAGLGLLMLLPLMALLALAIHRQFGSPIMFVQDRAGFKAKPFKILKFRSMTNATDKEGHLLPNDQRMTRFGMFLRSTSLDELPELWNVLKGDMSLVGPRPLLMDYLPYYDDNQKRRNEIKPGITGWTQVMGRNALDWNKKFELDIWYVDHFGFLLDLKILILTILKVIKREGIVHEGDVAMPRFDEYMLRKR